MTPFSEAALSLSTEYRLLVRAAQPDIGLSGGIDAAPNWRRLMAIAHWHRLTPLLWRYLRADGTDLDPPADVREELRVAYRTTAARNAMFGAELDMVLNALADAGIAAMLLKGSALIRSVYTDIGLRPMNDLDVLVPAASIQEAHRTVEGLGYAAMGAALSRDDEARVAGHFHHYPLMSRNRTAVIELHQHVTRAGPEFTIEDFWQRAVPGGGSPPYVLPSREDLFLHVGVHFAEDRLARQRFAIGQLADLLWIAHGDPFDWESLADRARAYGEGDRLFLALMSLQQLFDGVVPPHIADNLRPPSYRREMARRFVKLRVLETRPTLALEYYARGQWKIFAGKQALELHVRHDDDRDNPRLGRLRIRRVLSRIRRLAFSLMNPRRLLEDIRLSSWTVRLRGGRTFKREAQGG